MSVVGDFVSLFFPRYCMGCGNSLAKGEETLCTACLTELPTTGYHLLNDSPVKDKLYGRLPVRFGLAYLRFRKNGRVQRLLHELKYNNHPEVGEKLGQAYGRDLRQAGFDLEFDLIVPVPLHASRRRQRGYNQSAMFARGLSEALKVSWNESVSVRRESGATQTKKTKLARWENVKDAFAIDRQMSVADKRILLVDDVITTGATLEACGQHIISAGCKDLSIACIADA